MRSVPLAYPPPLINGYSMACRFPGATGATYNITSVVSTNGGNYSVVVSNGSGSVTSSVAALTLYVPPVAGPAIYTRNIAVYRLNIPISNLLSNVTHVDGDTITLVSVGPAPTAHRRPSAAPTLSITIPTL